MRAYEIQNESGDVRSILAHFELQACVRMFGNEFLSLIINDWSS